MLDDQASATGYRDTISTGSDSPEDALLNSERSIKLTPDTTEVAACATSTCTALVPARLYEHQYVGWPGRSVHQSAYHLNGYPILCSPVDTRPSSDTVLRLAEWAEQLGFEKHHVPKCPVATDVASSFDEDFRNSLEARPSDIRTLPEPGDVTAATQSAEGSPVEVGDEDYFTCQESASEIGMEEATLSDDEWADWDWDTEVQDTVQKEDPASNEDTDAFTLWWSS